MYGNVLKVRIFTVPFRYGAMLRQTQIYVIHNKHPLFNLLTRHCNCYGGLEDVIIDNDDDMLKMSYDGGYFMKNSPCSGKKH